MKIACITTNMSVVQALGRNICVFRPGRSNFRNFKISAQHIKSLHTPSRVQSLPRCVAVSVTQGYSSPHSRSRHSGLLQTPCQQALVANALLQIRFSSADTAVPPPPSAPVGAAEHGTATASVGTATDAAPGIADGYIKAPGEVDLLIPEPPKETEAILNALGEPTLSSLGLCNQTPVGLLQYLIENIHVMGDVPWWSTVVIVTAVMRLIVFPVFVKGRKGTINYTNHAPTLMKLQNKFNQARAQKDYFEAARVGEELQSFTTRNKVDPKAPLITPIVQAPIFISMIWAIRAMVNVPVESMKTGGLWWFTDLTVPDPYYILPVLTSLTVLATLEIGADTNTAKSMKPTMRYAMRSLPFVFLIFTTKFPACMLVYWLANNVFSLIQVAILKQPAIKKALDMPDPIIPEQPKASQKQEKAPPGVRRKIKFYWNKVKTKKNDASQAYRNSRKLAEIENRARAEAREWEKAGKSPIVKTYACDPTKVKKMNSA